MDSKIFIHQRQVLYQIGFISIGITVLLMPLSFSDGTNLFYFALSVFTVDVIGLYAGSRIRLDYGLGLILYYHVLSFTVAPFIGIGGFCFTLVYPVVYLWTLLSSRSRFWGVIYFTLNTACAIVALFQLRYSYANGLSVLNGAYDLFISTGVMVCLYLIGRLYFTKVDEYNKMREEQENVVTEKNRKLTNYIQTNLQLENFAHIASHELKTPVRGISNYAGLLEMSAAAKLDEKEKSYLSYVRQQAKLMYALTNDLLEYAKLSGSDVRYQRVNPNEEWERVTSKKIYRERRNIMFGDLPRSIVANRGQMNMLVKNLLENAIQHGRSPNGQLKIEVTGYSDREGYHFHIVDAGEGIRDVDKEEVFEIFKKFGDAQEGTGIGLAICKKIVDNHQGFIQILDVTAGGTDVYWFIPRLKLKKM